MTVIAASSSSTRNTAPRYKDVTWVRNANFEAMMAAHFPHVRCVYHEDVPLADINVQASRSNTARLGAPVSADQVETMLVLNQNQDLELPGVVFRKVENPRKNTVSLILADGNHRDEFCRKRRPTITSCSGYELIGVGDDTFQAIAKMCNSLNGRMSTPEERLQHAVTTYLNAEEKQDAVTVKAVAAQFGLNPHKLADHINAYKLRHRFLPSGDLAIPKYENVVRKLGILVCLSRIHNDRVLHATAEGIAQFKDIQVKTVAEAVESIVAVKSSEQAQLNKVEQVIADLAKRYDVTRRRNALPGATTLLEFRRAITSTNRLVSNNTDIRDVVAEPLREEMLEAMNTLQRNINKIKQALRNG